MMTQLALQIGGFPVAVLTGWTAHAVRHRRHLDKARRDPLTGLHTRAGWSARAERLIRATPTAAILLIDLNRFKRINDKYGHAAGDALLAETAARLTAWCRPGESVGRIGGDEFVAAIDAGSDLQARLDALRTALHQPVTAGDRCLPLAASIGVAQVAGLPGRDLSTALTAADADMYSAKGRSRRGRHAGGLLLHLVNRAA